MSAAEFPPAEAWAEFIAMRKRIKKPMTAYAEKLMLKRLAAFVVNGEDAEAVLNQSIRLGWQDVYAVKDEQQAQPAAPFRGRPQLSLVDQNRANNAEAVRLLGQPMFADDGMTIEAAL